MCFSEQVSFTAAAVLSGLAVCSLFFARKKREFLALAAIPIFFAFQQAAEGVEWLYFKNKGAGAEELKAAKDLFLLIAYPVWPFWIPFSLWLAEKKYQRKKVLEIFLLLGIVLSIYLGWCVLFYPTKVSVIGYSLFYETEAGLWCVIPFVAAVIPPWFISSLKWAKPLGIILIASTLVAGYVFTFHFVSVWCFFVAVISSGIAALCYANCRR
jgi:hypothetical protein